MGSLSHATLIDIPHDLGLWDSAPVIPTGADVSEPPRTTGYDYTTWWRYNPDHAGTVLLDVTSSYESNVAIALYTEAGGVFTIIPGTGYTDVYTYTVVAGVHYWVHGATSVAEAPIALTAYRDDTPAPPLPSAQSIVIAANGGTYTSTATSTDALVSPPEPDPPMSGYEWSTWWKYSPLFTGAAVFDVTGSARSDIRFCVFGVSAKDELLPIGGYVEAGSFPVAVGAWYYIQAVSSSASHPVIFKATRYDTPALTKVGLTNTGQGGVDTTAVSVLNSGGVSGDAFHAVNIDTAGACALTYDDTHGDKAFKVHLGPSGGAAAASWAFSPSLPRISGRVELYLPSPGVGHDASFDYMRIFFPAGYELMLHTSGNQRLPPFTDSPVDTPRALDITSSAKSTTGYDGIIAIANDMLPVDNWFRIEFDMLTTNPDGYVDVRLFGDRTTTEPLWRFAGPITWTHPGPVTGIQFGSVGGSAGLEYWFGNVNVGQSGIPAAGEQPALGEPVKGVDPLPPSGPDSQPPVSPPPVDPPWDGSGDFTDPFDKSKSGDAGDTIGSGAEQDSGSATVLELIREFSAAVRRAVRLVGVSRIEMVDPNAPLPVGFTQADAISLYHAADRTLEAGEKTLSQLAGDLALSGNAELVANDVRVPASSWRLPDQLPVYGIRPAPVKAISYTFTPVTFTGSAEFHFPDAPTL